MQGSGFLNMTPKSFYYFPFLLYGYTYFNLKIKLEEGIILSHFTICLNNQNKHTIAFSLLR